MTQDHYPPWYYQAEGFGEEEYHSESLLRRAPGTVARWALRERHLSTPLGVPVGLWSAGALAHARHLGHGLGYAAFAAEVATAILAGRKYDRWAEQIYADLTVAGGGGWLYEAASRGLTGPVDLSLLAMSAAWGGVFWWHKRPRDRRERKRHAAQVTWWDGWWQQHAAAWSVPGSHVTDVAETEAVTSLLIQFVKGRQTIDSLKNSLRLVESALDDVDGAEVPHGMIRLERVSASRAWLHLKHEDPLRGVIKLDLSSLPDDITRAAPLGVRESGGWLSAPLCRGWFILGKTRRGKSNETSVMFATITGCANARLWLIDRKGGRSMRPWLAAVDWPAVTIEEARLVLACAAAEERARGTYAYNGSEQLEPTREVPALFTAIDETHGVTGEKNGDAQCADSLATVASEGSGLAVYPIVTTQYGALSESVRTNQTRMNLDGRMCFQVDDPEDGTFALGNDARNNANPASLREKGQFYIRLNAETSPEQVRGPLVEHDQVREIAARNAKRTGLHERRLVLYCGSEPCPLMPGKTWQQVYDERWSRLPAAFHNDAPQGVTLTPSPSQQETPQPTKISNGYPPEVLTAVKRINADVAAYEHVSEDDLARARARRAARGEPPINAVADYDRRLHLFADAFNGAGPEGITPKALEQASGFSREWVRKLRNVLVERGAAEKVRTGLYRPQSDIWEALEALRAENERLAAEARQMTGV